MSIQRVPPLSRFEESPIRRLIADHLREVPVGEIATYPTLSELAGEDIRGAWHLVASAREVLLKEGLVFDVVQTVGLKRLDDDGKVAASEGYLGKVRNAARRSLKILRAADYAALSEAARTRYVVSEIRSGATLQFSRLPAVRKLEEAVNSGAEPRKLKAALGDVLKQFGG